MNAEVDNLIIRQRRGSLGIVITLHPARTEGASAETEGGLGA